ncbi:MAG TPA: hypothetical protein VF736_01480 [Pyrinomonadaceae bacterium]|jgi:hypothetical protein
MRIRSALKVLLLSAASWALGLGAGMLAARLYYGEPLSAADLAGFATLTLLPAMLVCLLLYTPGLNWLRRRRRGCTPAPLFPVASAAVLNLPVFALLASQSGASMAASEAVSFAWMFGVMGVAYGVGFVWRCRA